MNLISVIIPAYNCEKYIQKCLNSILKQSHENLEILIADDGSSDRTRKLIDSYSDPRIKRFHHPKNLGNVKTRNTLFEMAKGEYYCIQDADDWSDEYRLEKQLQFISDHQLKACACKSFRVKNDEIQKNLNTGNTFLPATIMIEKSIYQKVGGLPLLLERMIAEDSYWISKIEEETEIGILNEALYFYRDNPTSLSNTVNNNMLIGPSLIKELIRQRKTTGSDWVIQNNTEALEKYKHDLLNNSPWMQDRLFQMAIVLHDKNPEEAKRIFQKGYRLQKRKALSKRPFWVGIKLGLWKK